MVKELVKLRLTSVDYHPIGIEITQCNGAIAPINFENCPNECRQPQTILKMAKNSVARPNRF